jgi:hypothetical protein
MKSESAASRTRRPVASAASARAPMWYGRGRDEARATFAAACAVLGAPDAPARVPADAPARFFM